MMTFNNIIHSFFHNLIINTLIPLYDNTNPNPRIILLFIHLVIYIELAPLLVKLIPADAIQRVVTLNISI